MPPTFLEIAVVTFENNAAQKKFPQIQFPSYGSAITWPSLSTFLLESGLSYFRVYQSVSCWSVLLV